MEIAMILFTYSYSESPWSIGPYYTLLESWEMVQ